MSNKRTSLGKDVVCVLQSPVSSIKQKGNLTGNVRVLRDHIGDIYDLIQQWDKDLIEGVAVVSEIKRFMLNKIDAQKKNSPEFPHSNKLQVLSTDLDKICCRMKLLVEKLGQKSAFILTILRLEDMQHKTTPVFLTWPISKFVQTSQNIYEMYRREMELKISIKKEICFCADKSTLAFYSIAWLQQPYIEKMVNLNYEAMLKEAGYPSLYDKSTSKLNRIQD
ncbi:cyclin-dependent kinase 2-interacting protein-like [Planococcus citri]|uniref:cyclin-dependent kinase 2-interacting protein-like n=1 Tax=Planococcus citri TaxID=170843 RepID=UPI0031F9CBAE